MTRWRDPDFSNPVTMPRVTQGESARESDGADLAVITGWHDCQFATLVGGPFSKTCYVRSDLGPTRPSVTGAQGIDDLQAREVSLVFGDHHTTVSFGHRRHDPIERASGPPFCRALGHRSR